MITGQQDLTGPENDLVTFVGENPGTCADVGPVFEFCVLRPDTDARCGHLAVFPRMQTIGFRASNRCPECGLDRHRAAVGRHGFVLRLMKTASHKHDRLVTRIVEDNSRLQC